MCEFQDFMNGGNRFRRVQEGSGGFRRVQEGSGGFRRVQEGSGGFRIIRKKSEAIVSASLGGELQLISGSVYKLMCCKNKKDPEKVLTLQYICVILGILAGGATSVRKCLQPSRRASPSAREI
jgi:hypothetical protein